MGRQADHARHIVRLGQLRGTVEELLRNAAENGYTFAGWPNWAVLEDMRNCTDELDDFSDTQVLAALIQVRGADVRCQACTDASGKRVRGPCETCQDSGEVRP